MPAQTDLPLTLTLTGRPLLLYPNVLAELSARLQISHDNRAARLGDRARRMAARVRARAGLSSEPTGSGLTAHAASVPMIESPLSLPNATVALAPSDGPATSADATVSAGAHIAVIEIEGPLLNKAWTMTDEDGEPFICIDGYDRIEAAVARAVADPACAGVQLSIDSPGGMVNGCFECADALRELAAIKPIAAHTDGMMCSAAYAIGAATARISGAMTAYIGSVGVIYGRVDQTARLEQDGVRVDFITSGERKSWGYSETVMSEAEQADLVAEIDQLADMFAERVARTRPLDAAAVRALQAGTWMTGVAIEHGLADEIERLPDAVAALASAIAQPEPASPNPAPAQPTSTPGGPKPETETKEASVKSTLKMRAALSASLLCIATSMASNIPGVASGSTALDPDLLSAALASETEETVEAMDDEDIESMADEDTEAMEDDDDVEAMDEDEAEKDAEDDDEDGATARVASRIAHRAVRRARSAAATSNVDASNPMAVAQAITNLPEAKGQEALASSLAFSGIGVDGARDALNKASAAQAQAVRDARSANRPVPSPALGAGGRRSSSSGKTAAASALDEVIAKRNAKAGQA